MILDRSERTARRAGRRAAGLCFIAAALVLAPLASRSHAAISIDHAAKQLQAPSAAAPVMLARGGGGGGGGMRGLGHSGENSGFKADSIYGGGRGRDPYGASLDADPYRSSGRSKDDIQFAPANQGLHGMMKPKTKDKGNDDEDQIVVPDHRRMPHEDEVEEHRANKAAQRAADKDDRDNGDDNDSGGAKGGGGGGDN